MMRLLALCDLISLVGWQYFLFPPKVDIGIMLDIVEFAEYRY